MDKVTLLIKPKLRMPSRLNPPFHSITKEKERETERKTSVLVYNICRMGHWCGGGGSMQCSLS